jgi:two-component system sensor histidine kinase UhpB
MSSDAIAALGAPPDQDSLSVVARPTRGSGPRISPRTWWRDRSVRAQLLVIFVLVDLATILVAGGVTILKARTSTRIEIAASMKLAELLVAETITLFQERTPAETLLASLPLQLRFLRHVRIVVTDSAGVPVPPPPPLAEPMKTEERATAPGWFEALIAPALEREEVPVVVAGRRIGSVWVLGEPRDETAEVWGNTLALGAVAAIVNVTVIGLLYVLFGRVLTPLTGLAGGLSELEHHNYQVRLPRPRARELATIGDRFNALAQALEAARGENADLTRRLIRAQDDEKRRTAFELHDEVGPCLFGLKANTASISTAASEISDPAARRIEARVQDVLAIVDHLQAINRSLLNRLQPMALGHVPLEELLGEMVRERARQHPRLALSFRSDGLIGSYGDSLDLTMYRCVQESLTNVVRHAEASRVGVEIAEIGSDAGDRRLELAIRDDGLGIAPGSSKGFGLLGMQERVQAFGGRLAIENNPDGGACVSVVMPLGSRRDGNAGEVGG